MTISKLKENLENLKVPTNYYSLLIGGYPNECFCLIESEQDTFQVYYSEKGHKQKVKMFLTENDACEYMLEKLKKYKGKK